MAFLQKLLVFLTFLSANPTYQKYKRIVLKWLSEKINKKTPIEVGKDEQDPVTTELEEENIMSPYPEKLNPEAVAQLVLAAKSGEFFGDLKVTGANFYHVLGVVMKYALGDVEGNYTAEPLDEDLLAQLYALEDVEPVFGAEDDKSGMDPATILMLIQGLFNLLKMLGIFKKSSTSEVLD